MLVVFIVSQILDGGFTYGGVQRLGIDVEMNGLLVTMMHAIGPAAALTAAKTLACFCGVILYLTSHYRALAVAAGASIGVAVVPWCIVLLG